MDENFQIIPYYAHPHVFTTITDNSQYDETVGTATEATLPFSTVVVAGADKGIDNKFIRLQSLSEKVALFGRGNFAKYGQSSLQADFLFNGSTYVWFCRVLPENATYSNLIVMMNYRKGNEYDELGHETGLKRMEVKFTVERAVKPYIVDGATDDSAILQTAYSYATDTADPQTGYLRQPLFYVRSTGRGNYGDNYGIRLTRDQDAEKEYECKMYLWSLIQNGSTSRVINKFSGALYQTTKGGVSTLISDVLDQFDTGKCPVYIYPFEETLDTLYDFYQEIVEENADYLSSIDATEDQLAALETARNIDEEDFDPIFGYSLLTITNASIPYFQNYTVKSTGAYVAPDMEVATASRMPQNTSDWSTATVGSTVLVLADENNGGYRWRYTVAGIDTETGNITYDEGVENFIDDAEYDGVNISAAAGIDLAGGSDGDFDTVTNADGTTRAPSPAEMKLLLAREQVKAFRGEKDRTILSPSRIDLDFIFDANYNMTSEDDLAGEGSVQTLYSNSSVLTDADYAQLTVSLTNAATIDLDDLNVKAAMYDLNEFRNRNGMTVAPDMGAGCSLYLDCGAVGFRNSTASSELVDTMTAMADFTGRATSIDLGYYNIFDPYTGKRIAVTATYYLAENLIPHLLRNGLNQPFVYRWATMTTVQRSAALTQANAMIRDSFRPDIDLIDWDVKEALYTNRFNYYITSDEGRTVQRACQNTRQLEASALLEENNVRVLNTLKKGLERDCNGYLYQWNEPTVRKSFTDDQMEKYKPWIGSYVQSLDIRFDANDWEQERMIMHCYVSITFRDIIKRIILEININRSEYSSEGGVS